MNGLSERRFAGEKCKSLEIEREDYDLLRERERLCSEVKAKSGEEERAPKNLHESEDNL